MVTATADIKAPTNTGPAVGVSVPGSRCAAPLGRAERPPPVVRWDALSARKELKIDPKGGLFWFGRYTSEYRFESAEVAGLTASGTITVLSLSRSPSGPGSAQDDRGKNNVIPDRPAPCG